MNNSVRFKGVTNPVMCWQMKLTFVVVVIMVLKTNMFVTRVFVIDSQVLCGVEYLT